MRNHSTRQVVLAERMGIEPMTLSRLSRPSGVLQSDRAQEGPERPAPQADRAHGQCDQGGFGTRADPGGNLPRHGEGYRPGRVGPDDDGPAGDPRQSDGVAGRSRASRPGSRPALGVPRLSRGATGRRPCAGRDGFETCDCNKFAVRAVAFAAPSPPDRGPRKRADRRFERAAPRGLCASPRMTGRGTGETGAGGRPDRFAPTASRQPGPDGRFP